MAIQWNEEAIAELTDDVYDQLDQFTDEELMHLLNYVNEDHWKRYLKDEGFALLIRRISILGIASFGQNRALLD